VYIVQSSATVVLLETFCHATVKDKSRLSVSWLYVLITQGESNCYICYLILALLNSLQSCDNAANLQDPSYSLPSTELI
jgi:hypothetical protein